ncbi:hypothetical protein O181_046006 [Austropuccinia psidii MF-1]|uniref:Uncharacterized protein n=1 Tax=Austropuccinia psidii MF-1 TaxID=1389203 RepID=A0A9Q3HI87_9BASI|nr:hypothetical protein [Austropuccinia psidii MF-1]
MTTPIQKRRIQSTSLSPVQASTTTNEVIRPPQPPQPPMRSPTRPSTLASTSTNIQHMWPVLLETQCLQNLNQSLTTVTTGIELETSLIRRRCSPPYFLKFILWLRCTLLLWPRRKFLMKMPWLLSLEKP